MQQSTEKSFLSLLQSFSVSIIRKAPGAMRGALGGYPRKNTFGGLRLIVIKMLVVGIVYIDELEAVFLYKK